MVHANWESLVNDKQYQFDRKSERDFWPIITNGHYLMAFWMMTVGGIYAYRKRLPVFELLFIAVPCWLIWPIGHELWYEVIDHVGFLFISVFVIHIWLHIVFTRKIVRREWLQLTLVVLFSIGLLLWNYQGERIENIFRYSVQARLVTMKVIPEVDYFTPDDNNCLSDMLTSLSHDNNGLVVEFQPEADAFLFLDLAQQGFEFICPLFEKRRPDIIVVHRSRNLPQWWPFGDRALERAGLTKDSVQHIWYSRDETEQWFVAAMSDQVRLGAYYQNMMTGLASKRMLPEEE
jgi:hypothetical protein